MANCSIVSTIPALAVATHVLVSPQLSSQDLIKRKKKWQWQVILPIPLKYLFFRWWAAPLHVTSSDYPEKDLQKMSFSWVFYCSTDVQVTVGMAALSACLYKSNKMQWKSGLYLVPEIWILRVDCSQNWYIFQEFSLLLAYNLQPKLQIIDTSVLKHGTLSEKNSTCI